MGSPTKYELLEHTADVGVRAFGADLGEVFANTALGMMEIICDPATVRPQITKEIRVHAADRESLLVAWLNEIIFLIESEEMLFKRFEINHLSATLLEGAAVGEPIDTKHHELRTTVKACTYHELEIYEDGPTWVGRVIFDV